MENATSQGDLDRLSGQRKSVKQEAPTRVRKDPRLLEVWTRSHHILPAAAFETEFADNVLLPVKSQRVRIETSNLRRIIVRVPGLNIKELSKLSGIPYGRCRAILYLRDKIEWRVARSSGENAVRSFPLKDDGAARLIPKEDEISVEYLVAELEREGFDLRVELWPGGEERLTLLPTGLAARTWWPGLGAWLVEFGEAIRLYVKKRDGLSPPRTRSWDR